MKENALILFLKYPEPGEIKTRLAAKLGDDLACQLYLCFLKDIAVMSHQVTAQTMIVYAGTESAAFADFPGVTCLRQRGRDIGERMFFAMQDVLAQGFERAVLIGSDIPDLPPGLINDAFGMLRSVDVVLGPSTDGGYYLVGGNRGSFCQSMFSNIPWSTARVFSETLKRIAEAGLASAELKPWSDIDDFDNLKQFYERNRNASASSHVMRFLKTKGIIHEV